MNSPEEPWIATSATVTTCRFQSPGLGTLAFGFQTTQKYRITFDYYAHGRLYSDQFQSPIAIPQNTLISISYNPLDPQQNSQTNHPGVSSASRPPRGVMFVIGIFGSVILSLLWLASLRGCN